MEMSWKKEWAHKAVFFWAEQFKSQLVRPPVALIWLVTPFRYNVISEIEFITIIQWICPMKTICRSRCSSKSVWILVYRERERKRSVEEKFVYIPERKNAVSSKQWRKNTIAIEKVSSLCWLQRWTDEVCRNGNQTNLSQLLDRAIKTSPMTGKKSFAFLPSERIKEN